MVSLFLYIIMEWLPVFPVEYKPEILRSEEPLTGNTGDFPVQKSHGLCTK